MATKLNGAQKKIMMIKKLTQKEIDEICARENELMVQAILESEIYWEDMENSEISDNENDDDD